MSEVNFFEPKGPFYLNKLLENLKINKSSVKIYNIKTLSEASNKDITFLIQSTIKTKPKKQKPSPVLQVKNLNSFYQVVVLK